MRYYLKKCGFQELGSVGSDGKAKRGRYLMTSMNPEILDFFPPLSRNVLNDNALIPVIPLYLGKKVYCNYVYHNSKYCGSEAKHKRNEYRIYLNGELENNQLLFCAEDIVVIREGTISYESELQSVYFLDLVSDHSSREYIQLSKTIEEYPINGGYGVFEGELPDFEERVGRILDANNELIPVLDKKVESVLQKNDNISHSLFNVGNFRDFVLIGYRNRCALTGDFIDASSNNRLDVVYIRPLEKGGQCHPNNGIVFIPSIAQAFVRGKFTLSDDFEVIVHPLCNDADLRLYDSCQIKVPSNALFRPSRDNIIFHRESIYGAFASVK